jgi:transposase
MNKLEAEESAAVLVGLDWADEKHDLWLWERASEQKTHQVLEQTPECLSAWLADMQSRYAGGRIAICLEQSKGALIYSLLGYDFLTLYPINPLTLAKYRQAFHPSRAKDDPTDAELLLDILRKHPEKLRVWQPDDVQTRTLALLNEDRRKAVDLRTRFVLRLTATLKIYFPQALRLIGQLKTTLACDFLLKWPTLQALQRASPKTIRAFYYAHNCRAVPWIEENLKTIPSAKPLTSDPAVIASCSLTTQTLAKQIRTLLPCIEKYDRRIAEIFRNHPDRLIFESLPGAGLALAPRLLTAFGSDRDRFVCPTDIQTYSGIAPVIERSGKSCWIHWRWNCPKFLRQSLHEFANCSLRYCGWAKAYYDLQIERGKGHHAAIRALAFKWLRILYRCWHDRTPYHESHYLQSLKKSGSPLWQTLNSTPKETPKEAVQNP